MTTSKKLSIQKKIERLRKTLEINEIVERGRIEDQALLDSAGESRPADELHATDLLTRAQLQSVSASEARSMPQRMSRKKSQSRRSKPKAKKAKRSRR